MDISYRYLPADGSSTLQTLNIPSMLNHGWTGEVRGLKGQVQMHPRWIQEGLKSDCSIRIKRSFKCLLAWFWKGPFQNVFPLLSVATSFSRPVEIQPVFWDNSSWISCEIISTFLFSCRQKSSVSVFPETCVLSYYVFSCALVCPCEVIYVCLL